MLSSMTCSRYTLVSSTNHSVRNILATRRLSQACPLFLFASPFLMDLSEQPRTGAAQRRKQRRLRSWWRHEQQSIAAALATSLHHSSRGQRKARAGEEESELHHTDKDRKTPPPQPVLFSQFDEEEPVGRRPASLAEPLGPQERVQRHTMEQLADVAPMVPSLAAPEPQMVDQLVAMVKHVDSVVPEQIIAVPKISWPSRFPRTVLREPQLAEQLVEVPVPAPSFSDWVRWEETYRRTGHTWLGGFEWCLTASPGGF